MAEIRELPRLTSFDEVTSAVNVRLRDVREELGKKIGNPAETGVDVDANQNRIVQLADPKDDQDGVNLRTLRHYIQPDQRIIDVKKADVPDTKPPIVNYAIYFMRQGNIADDTESLPATINTFRTGFAFKVSFTADTPPASGSFKFNFHLDIPLVGKVDLFKDPFEVAAGEKGPVYTTNMEYVKRLPEGTKIRLYVKEASGAADFVAELVMAGVV